MKTFHELAEWLIDHPLSKFTMEHDDERGLIVLRLKAIFGKDVALNITQAATVIGVNASRVDYIGEVIDEMISRMERTSEHGPIHNDRDGR